MATFQLAVNGSRPEGPPKDAPSTVSAREHLRKGVPDIYRRDFNARNDQPPPFAIRFLHALEEVLDPIVATLDSLPAHLDVDLAPEHALAGLATWLGVDDVEALPAKQRREAVRRAGELARAARDARRPRARAEPLLPGRRHARQRPRRRRRLRERR